MRANTLSHPKHVSSKLVSYVCFWLCLPFHKQKWKLSPEERAARGSLSGSMLFLGPVVYGTYAERWSSKVSQVSPRKATNSRPWQLFGSLNQVDTCCLPNRFRLSSTKPTGSLVQASTVWFSSLSASNRTLCPSRGRWVYGEMTVKCPGEQAVRTCSRRKASQLAERVE